MQLSFRQKSKLKKSKKIEIKFHLLERNDISGRSSGDGRFCFPQPVNVAAGFPDHPLDAPFLAVRGLAKVVSLILETNLI